MSFNKLTGSILIALTSQAANASGFALIEQSASGQGLSYAGAAANAEDASVMWFNPAGLTEIEGSQAIVGMHVILPTAKFTDSGSAPGGTDDDGTVDGLVPNLYWKGDFKGYAIGLGVTVPFGQKIVYTDDWAGRYQAIKTDLKTVNLNANIARKLNDKVSVGFGLNAQYVHLTMGQKIDQTVVSQPDGDAEIEADSLGFGFNLGLMAKISEATQLGFAYRSEVSHAAKGSVSYDNVHAAVMAGGSLVDGSSVHSDVTLPASASLSVAYKANSKLKVLADATWTGWAAYDELIVEFDSGASASESNQDFGDSMRYSLGAIYALDDQWILRTGLAVDKTPVPSDEARSARTPDNDRTWLSVGANYKLNKKMYLDLAYSHVFATDTGINNTSITGTGSSTLTGDYDLAIDIVSAQLVWNY